MVFDGKGGNRTRRRCYVTPPVRCDYLIIRLVFVYRIFSIKCPGVYFNPGLRDPAFNLGPAFINEVKFSSFFRLMYCFTFFEIRAQLSRRDDFSWTRPDIMSLYLIHTVLHTALDTVRV